MRATYGAKRASMIDGLAPLATRGWTWSENTAGLHLLIRHADRDHVRAGAATPGLDLALMSAYRTVAAPGDGLFLRFGGLDARSLESGVAALAAADARARG